MRKGTFKGKDSETRHFGTDGHKGTDREVRNPNVKRDTGVERLPRFFSTAKRSVKVKSEQSCLTVESSKDVHLVL